MAIISTAIQNVCLLLEKIPLGAPVFLIDLLIDSSAQRYNYDTAAARDAPCGRPEYCTLLFIVEFVCGDTQTSVYVCQRMRISAHWLNPRAGGEGLAARQRRGGREAVYRRIPNQWFLYGAERMGRGRLRKSVSGFCS